MTDDPMLIDGLEREHPVSALGTRWALVLDGVMGGVSTGHMARETVGGRTALRMTGDVRLENDGGFVQIALDLAPDGGPVDVSSHWGIALEVMGNDETYGVHLRTADVARPWQSYRARFIAPSHWTTVTLPFDAFAPHRIAAPLDLARLRRIGIVAIGRAFHADLALASIRIV